MARPIFFVSASFRLYVMSGEPVPAVGRHYLRTAVRKLQSMAKHAKNPKHDALYARVVEACDRLPMEARVEEHRKKPPPPPLPVPARSSPAKPRWQPRLTGEPRPAPPVRAGLPAELAKGLRAIDITSRHVANVVEVNHGRPVRFDRASRIVYVNSAHPVVRALAGDPQRNLLLGVAAISEINRELAVVTDAEERRVLTDLLRSGG